MVKVNDFRGYFEKYCLNRGLRKVKKGIFEFDTVDEPICGLYETFVGKAGYTSLNAKIYIDFKDVTKIAREIRGAWKDKRQGLFQVSVRNVENFEIDEYCLDHIDSRIDRLLDKFIDCGLIFRNRCRTVDEFYNTINNSGFGLYALDNSLNPFNPMYSITPIACAIFLGKYKLIKEVIDFYYKNEARRMDGDDWSMLKNVETILSRA